MTTGKRLQRNNKSVNQFLDNIFFSVRPKLNKVTNSPNEKFVSLQKKNKNRFHFLSILSRCLSLSLFLSVSFSFSLSLSLFPPLCTAYFILSFQLRKNFSLFAKKTAVTHLNVRFYSVGVLSPLYDCQCAHAFVRMHAFAVFVCS